jgi:hypothetical protein
MTRYFGRPTCNPGSCHFREAQRWSTRKRNNFFFSTQQRPMSRLPELWYE